MPRLKLSSLTLSHNRKAFSFSSPVSLTSFDKPREYPSQTLAFDCLSFLFFPLSPLLILYAGNQPLYRTYLSAIVHRYLDQNKRTSCVQKHIPIGHYKTYSGFTIFIFEPKQAYISFKHRVNQPIVYWKAINLMLLLTVKI